MTDIVTASERIDQLQASIVALEQQFAAEKAARLKSDAAVAEMRDAAFCHCGKPAACLVRYEGDGPAQFACDECCGHGNEDGWCKRLDDCGDGWLSPEDRATVREFIEDNSEHLHATCFSGYPHPNCRKCKILALLDGREAK